jgi:ERCC4-type nuclease
VLARAAHGIFWQSPRTTRKARPGIRVPTRRASGHAELEILVDTRERYPYRFARQQATTRRQALPAGDYGVSLDAQLVAAVERKSLADLTSSLIDGSLTYQLADLARLPRAAVVVEDRYANIFKLEHASPGFVAELLATVQIRYPTIPIIFTDTRPLAEEWTFRFLGAALALAHADHDADPPS